MPWRGVDKLLLTGSFESAWRSPPRNASVDPEPSKMIQNLPVRGDEMDHFQTHEIRPGDGSKERGNRSLQAFRIPATGDLPAALCHHLGPPREILITAPKGGVDLGVETRFLVQVVTIGRLGPDLNPRRMSPHHLVVGVGLVAGL